jgi:hypothetical protein
MVETAVAKAVEEHYRYPDGGIRRPRRLVPAVVERP